MRRDTRTWGGTPRAAALALLLGSVVPAALSAAEEDGVRIVVDSPAADEVVRGRTDLAPLSGVALAGDRPTHFDLMLVIDVSGSTRYPSGIDVDGDGSLGRQKAALVSILDTVNTDPEDSILAAEIAGARRLLEQLDPERVRVGVVSFSGEIDPSSGRRRSVDQVDSLLEHPLSSDYERVAVALDAVLLRGPHGGTNMEAGVKRALRELTGVEGGVSVPQPGAKKVILLMTDGKPSLPFGRADVEDPADVEAVVAAARLSGSAGITINVYGLGPGAIDYPHAATEVARATAGLYTPVRRPGDIVSLLSGVSFANVEDVVAVNLTLSEWAGPDDILLRPDGSFRGFVPVRPGLNRIRVSALASDGTRGSTELDIMFIHQDLSDGELGLELERIRNRSRELQLLMERDRQEDFRRRERERTLSIEVDGGEGESQP